jgi:hypothetical protein
MVFKIEQDRGKQIMQSLSTFSFQMLIVAGCAWMQSYGDYLCRLTSSRCFACNSETAFPAHDFLVPLRHAA